MKSWCDYYNSQSTLCINETYPSTYWLDVCKQASPGVIPAPSGHVRRNRRLLCKPIEIKCRQINENGERCINKAKIGGYCYICNNARNIQRLINQQKIRYEEKIRGTREIGKVIKKKRCSQLLKNRRHCKKNAKYGKYCYVHKADSVYS